MKAPVPDVKLALRRHFSVLMLGYYKFSAELVVLSVQSFWDRGQVAVWAGISPSFPPISGLFLSVQFNSDKQTRGEGNLHLSF